MRRPIRPAATRMRMSATLENIITALKAVRSLDRYPVRNAVAACCLPGNMEVFDQARECYYLDDRSRTVFDWCCQSRIIGAMYGGTPRGLPGQPFTAEEWEALEQQAEAMPAGSYAEGDYLLDRVDTWLLESYSLKGRCEVLPGDVVLDCGSHSGNTCLYFARKAGPEGRVYGFEPSRSTFAQLQQNMRTEPTVQVHNCAVSEHSGIVSFFEGGPMKSGSFLTQGGDVSVYAFSIDDFARKQRLERVDFIKMDIEGAEEAALLGAREVIAKCRPRMALSAYHKEMDIVTLPRLVASLAPGYRFALRHFSMELWETVLYCWPE